MQMHKDITQKAIKEFIGLEEKCNIIHNFKYSYTKTIYKFATTKTIIICPIHGEFLQNIREHLLGHGCRQCARKAVGTKATKTTATWVKQATETHNNKYNYSLVNYTHSKTPITIICPIHGPFTQIPNSHLNGAGCKDCGDISIVSANKLSNKEFITKAKLVHGDRYNYSKVNYINSKTEVIIICKEHGEFQQRPDTHTYRKSGCSECSGSGGFDKTKPAILYYLSINNGQAYKIGITNKTIKDRFGADIQNITVLHQVHYKSGQDAYNEEQRILKEYKQYKYTGPSLLKSGNTELFNIDIRQKWN